MCPVPHCKMADIALVLVAWLGDGLFFLTKILTLLDGVGWQQELVWYKG